MSKFFKVKNEFGRGSGRWPGSAQGGTEYMLRIPDAPDLNLFVRDLLHRARTEPFMP